MKRQWLTGLLTFVLLTLCFVSLTMGQVQTSIWKEDMSYSSYNQFQTAGWTSEHEAGVSFTSDGVILDGTTTDTAIHYSNKFPSGIYDWVIEDRSRWVLGSHSGNIVSAITQYHSYGFSADGWYSNFAFYRDNQKILTFGSYQEQSNQWFTLRMEKHGNQIDMYFNDILENSYTETDTALSQLVGVDLVSPWLGGAEYDYIQIWSTNAVSTGDLWTSFGHDISGARYSTSTAPKTSQLLWKTQLSGEVRSAITVYNNKAYVGTFGGTFYALDATDGKTLWTYNTNGDIWSTAAGANGIIYFGSNDFSVYALNAETGAWIWSFPTGGGVFSSPTVVDNVVYVGSTDKNMYALNANTGAKIWSYTTRGEIRSSPAVVNGVVYFGCFVNIDDTTGDGYFYALDAATGTEIWSSPTGDNDTYTNSSPAVVEGVVYVGSTDGNLYAFRTTDGHKLWSFSVSGSFSSSPAVHNGIAYIGSYTNLTSGVFYAINCGSGTQVWSYPLGGAVFSSPAIADGVVYIGSYYQDNSVHAFDASSGNLLWSYQTNGGVFSSPTIAGSVMFVGSYDRSVYAFGSEFNVVSTSTTSFDYVTKTAWVPPATGGVAATVVTVGAVSASAIVAAAVTSVPAAASVSFLDKLVGKVRDLLPSSVKKWLESLIASKRKINIEEKTGSTFLLTKPEMIAYTLAIFILTFSFAYVKVNTFMEFLYVLPTFIITSLIVGVIRTYILITFARTRGVWAEYKLWYFGVVMYIISTVAFRMPFSSPTRNVYHSKNMTAHIGFLLSCIGISVTLGFAGFFLFLQNAGFALIGSSGLGMCLIAAFFDTLPIKPMGGSYIFNYNKKYWTIMFITTMVLYGVWLLQTL